MKAGRPYLKSQVRPDYWAGTWEYAIGAPATRHPDYAGAVKLAVKGPNSFNPWFIRTWADVDAAMEGCWFDYDAGARVPEIFRKVFRHSIAPFAGQPFVLMDWQEWDVTMPIFGWMRPDGTRRFRKVYIEIPKKNGKSTWCAGLGHYFLTKDNEAGAHVCVAAGDRNQAGIIHDESARMARKSPDLLKRLKIVDSRKTIYYPDMEAKYEALSADAGLKEGLNWSALLFDELHVQKDRVFFDSLVYGDIARSNPMMIMITTAGVYDIGSICWEQHDYASKVYDGTVKDPYFFSYIASAPADAPWTDPETWKRANLSWGVIIKQEKFEADVREAVEKPAKQNSLRRYRLNQWTHQTERWLDQSIWQRTTVPNFETELRKKQCYGGLDLSSVSDLTARVLWFPKYGGQPKNRIIYKFWLPEDNIDQLEKDQRAPFRQWAEEGWLHLTAGPVVDYDAVYDDVVECKAMYGLEELAFDPHNATNLITRLMKTFGEEFAVEHTQGMGAMSPPTKETERLLLSGDLEHDENPVMAWMFGNCQAVHNSSDDVKIMKADGKIRFKVDGPIAMIMACSRAMVHSPKGKSIYETRGIPQIGVPTYA